MKGPVCIYGGHMLQVPLPESPKVKNAPGQLNGIHLGYSSIILALGILVLSVCTSQTSWAQSKALFLSPGIKMSHAFGEQGGFVFGLELSCYGEIRSRREDLDLAGFLIDVDWCNNQTRIQLGLEGSHRFVGFSIGPSLILNQEQHTFGVTGTLYSWFIILPYYGYTYVFDKPDIHELGLYIKIPIQISGRRFFGGSLGG